MTSRLTRVTPRKRKRRGGRRGTAGRAGSRSVTSGIEAELAGVSPLPWTVQGGLNLTSFLFGNIDPRSGKLEEEFLDEATRRQVDRARDIMINTTTITTTSLHQSSQQSLKKLQ